MGFCLGPQAGFGVATHANFVRGATHANFVIQNHFVGVVHKALLDTKSRKETKEKRSNPAAPQPRSSVSHTTANGLLPWPS